MIERLQPFLAKLPKRSPAARRTPSKSTGWRKKLIAVGLFLLAALCGFWLAFPEQQLLQRGRLEIYRATGLVLTASSMELTFPLGVRLVDCRVEPLPSELPLVLEEVELDPAWWQLLSGNPVFDVSVVGMGGTLEGQVGTNGLVDVQMEGVDLAGLPVLPSPYRLNGELSGAAAGNLRSREGLKLQARLSAMQLSGLDAFGVTEGLRVGKLEAEGVLQGNNLKMDTVTLADGVLDANGKGTVIVGGTPQASRLAASVQIRPTASMPEMFKELLTLSGKSPDPEGWYSFRLNGRLDAPNFR